MGTSPRPDPRTPPLAGTTCPDPNWVANRALWIQGVENMVGPRWVIMLGPGGALPGPPPLPPVIPPLVPEGSTPFMDDLGTPFIDDLETP
jgi:hypothetical protein